MSAARRLADPGYGFVEKLIALAAAGLAIRLVYAFSLHQPGGDAVFYHEVANSIADGSGFVDPFSGQPTAAHPPLFPLLLSVVSLLGGTSMDAHQAAGCVIGAATSLPVGFVGRRLGGPFVGVLAAAGVAVYPPMIANDAFLYSESLYGLSIALLLLAAIRLLERPAPGDALAFGIAVGFTALVRVEALLLLALLGVPLACRIAEGRWRRLAMVVLGTGVIVLPWTARNWIVFDQPVLISTNDSTVLAGANCRPVYQGADLGSWQLDCLSRPREGIDEAEQAEVWRDQGLDYASGHLGELPKVVAARVGRTWSLYRQGHQVRLNRFFRGSPAWLEWLTVASFYLAALLAAVGAVALRQRRAELLILASLPVLVTIASASGFGTPRFREAAEVAIVLLASLGIGAAVDAMRRRRGTRPAPLRAAGPAG
jgi:Dolichyl-phosphate-mannose-protein mannosyltransferase